MSDHPSTDASPAKDSPAASPGWTRWLGRIDHWISLFEAFVLAWGVILMALNSVANVLGRFVFQQSLYFSEELNQFLIVLITFVGLGYAARQGRHIRMSAFYDQLSDRGRKILMIIIAAITAVIMLMLTYYAVQFVGNLARRGRVTPALQVPLYLTFLWVPVGFAITGIQYALTVVRNVQSEGVWISYEQLDGYDETDHTQGP